MVRRSLRAGLWLGLMVGLAWSLRRVLLLRRAATTVDVSRDPWTPLPQPDAEPPGPKPSIRTTTSATGATVPGPETTPAATATRLAAQADAPKAMPPTAVPEAVGPTEVAKVTKAASTTNAAKATKASKASKASKAAKPRTWVAPQDGECPPGHPVKAKMANHIFRVPGMLGYEQTKPDRCFPSEADARADGFTRAKR
jgi:putative endonuclease